MRIKLSDHFTVQKLLRYTLPSVAMMIFMSVYSVVDGFFVSNFAGKTPFAAVNLMMPVLMIFSTVGFMFGTGGTALVAKICGEGDREKANQIFSLLVYLAFGIGVAFCVLGVVFARPIAALLGADGELLGCCVLYFRVILLALPFSVLQMMFQTFFSAAEKPTLGFWVTVSSGVMNMILDAILCISLPQAYKLLGAAIATAVSQLVGGLVPVIYFFRKNDSLLRLGRTKFDGKAVRKACANGSSEFMNNVSMSLVGMLFNLQLMKYAGEDGISAYGVMMYVSMIFTAIFVGYSIGVSPIISFHFGAQNHPELRSLLRKSLVICGTCGSVMVLSGFLLAGAVSNLFVGYDADLRDLTVHGFRIFSLSFAFIGFGIFTSGFFTALNDGLTSAVISFVRTLILETAAVMLLPLIFGIDGIWYATVVSESLALLLGAMFLFAKRKKYRY